MDNERGKRNPNFYMTFKPGPTGISRENKLLLPSTTPKEWMKKLHDLDRSFDFPPNFIANIEIFEHSGMAQFIAEKIDQYEGLRETGNHEMLEQFNTGLLDEISDRTIDSLANKFNMMQGNKADLVVLEAFPQYYIDETRVNAGDPYFGKIEDKLASEHIDDTIQMAQNISAYWNLNEMSLVLFRLLTGRQNLGKIYKTETVSDSLEKTLFSGSPSMFLSTVAYLITSFDTLLTLKKQGKLQKYPSDFFDALAKDDFFPIVRAIATLEFSETNPANTEHGPYYLSQFSQLMAYLSDLYYNNLLKGYGINPPITTDPKQKKERANQLNRSSGLPIENFVWKPSHGLVYLLAEAGLPETMMTLDLLLKTGKVSLQSTFKNGFRILMDEHPSVINYLGQLRNLRPELNHDLDVAKIYKELLEAKLSLSQYGTLAEDPEFYLRTRNYFKFRIVAEDGLGFDEVVNSVIRDLIQDRKQLEQAPIAKDAPWILDARERIRENQQTNLKEIFTLFVNPTATTRIVPFTDKYTKFYQKMVDGSPTEIIRKQYQKGGRAMFFIRLNIPMAEQNFPVEVQVVPKSVEQQLHQQRENYLTGRIFGYLGTPELIQEFVDEEEIGNYVV